MDESGNGTIEVIRYDPNEVSFGVHTDKPAMLVLSDLFYPGWQGYLDGAKAPIYRADATFRGMMIPPGSHAVQMRFRPRSLQIGIGLSIIGLILVLAAFVADKSIKPLFLQGLLARVRRAQ